MKNPERVRGRRGGVEGRPGARDGGEGAEEGDIEGADKRLETSAASVAGGPDCTVEVYMSEEGVTVLGQGGAPRKVRAAKSSEFG